MNKLQLMQQQLEQDEKKRFRKNLLKELFLITLGLISLFGGIIFTIWLLTLNYYLVFIPASLSFITWILYSLTKGVRTGVIKGSATTPCSSAPIFERKKEPYVFWFVVVFNMCLVFGVLYWLSVDPFQKIITDGLRGLKQ
tara:strand:+ start:694 stop:1113 length:420 start_codon:yes stop_codon:yes gene_type:complete